MALSVQDLSSRYAKLSSPVVYDILDKMGYPHQVLSNKIQPLANDMVVAGPAFTIKGNDSAPGAPKAAITSYEVFRKMYAGCVLVVDLGHHTSSGPWGENTSLTAQMKGVAGCVMDGYTRDANQIVGLKFPCFATGVTPVFAEGRYRMEAMEIPVSMSGHLTATVTVHPGDFVFGDRDGVVIVPKDIAEEVLLACEKLEEIEKEIRVELEAGGDREIVYKKHAKFAHVRRPAGVAQGEGTI
jgi:4-hydroxy-4-methyl-2-oxoglutarate aldolase